MNTEIDDEDEKIGHRRAYRSCQAEKGQVSAMVFRIIALAFAGLLFSHPAWAVVLENPAPGSIKSGVGVVSGWICDADELEVSFNQGERQFMPYGSERVDTLSVCDDTDNGFGLLINYNNLGDGPHTVTLYADGEVATQVQFNVRTLGTDFLRGVTGQGSVELSDGKHVAIQWQETVQGFTITDYNYTGTFPGLDTTPEKCTQDPLPEEYYGECGSVRWSCANGTRVHRQDTETHYRWGCLVSICGETAECEEEKEVTPPPPTGVDKYAGSWIFKFGFDFFSPCHGLSPLRFTCAIDEGLLSCVNTRWQVPGESQPRVYGLQGDVTASGSIVGEIVRGEQSTSSWAGKLTQDSGFGEWSAYTANGCYGTWSATRR